MSGSNNYLSGTSFTFEPAANYNVTGINNVLIIGTANAIVSQAFINASTNNPVYTPLANAVIAADTTTVGQLYGIDSVISKMYTAYRSNDPITTCYLLPLIGFDTAVSGASISYAVTGDPSFIANTAGTLNAYVAGTLVQSPVYLYDTATAVATNLANAIMANPYFTANCSASENEITFVTRTSGDFISADIDFRLNYAGAVSGQYPIAGVIVTAGGFENDNDLDADVATPLANLAAIQFDAIVTPYTDSTSMAAYNTLLNQTTGRWSPTNKLFGHVFTARKDTFANLVTFLQSYNTEFITTLMLPGNNIPARVEAGNEVGYIQDFGTPTTVYEAAAYFAGACVTSLAQDVGTPLQALPLTGILAEPAQSRFTPSELNTLLQYGGAVYKVGAGNVPILNRAVTMYTENSLGIADDTFKDTSTMYVLEYVIETFLQVLGETYARVRLVDPSTPIPQGADFTNVTAIESTCISIYSTLNTQGYVSYVNTFATNVSATSLGNGTVKVYCPITLASPLIQLVLNFVVSLT